MTLSSITISGDRLLEDLRLIREFCRRGHAHLADVDLAAAAAVVLKDTAYRIRSGMDDCVGHDLNGVQCASPSDVRAADLDGGDVQRVWNICLPGPSFDAATVPDEGVVVCVNLALADMRRCHYWVSLDAPNELHEIALPSFRRLRPTVVTQRGRLHAWRRFLRSAGVPDAEMPAILEPIYGPEWLVPVVPLPRYSVILAVSFAVMMGAAQVRLHGCDMVGTGYYNGLGQDILDRYPSWDGRWDCERAMLEDVQAAAVNHGISVVRMSGKPRRRSMHGMDI